MSDLPRPRVLIADDHTLIAEAFNKMLEADFDVVGIVHDGRGLIHAAQRLEPDVILVDIGLPLLNGLEAAQRIKRVLPEVKIVCVTISHDPDLVAEAFRRGASGYLSKAGAASELFAAIHKALQGGSYVSPSLLMTTSKSSTDGHGQGPAMTQLTERQVEVLQLLAEGRSMKEVAAVLNLATRTVAFHKYRIREHLRLNNDAETVRFAVRNHVVSSS